MTQEILLSTKNKEIKIDASFLLINKFINLLMKDGKKAKATRLLLESFNHLKKKMLFNSLKESNKGNLFTNAANATNENLDVLRVFTQAIENVAPSLEVRKVRKAGTTFLVPAAVIPTRGTFKAMSWIIEVAQNKRGSSLANREFAACLADEIALAAQKQGKAREKRNELHKLAIANRAYTRYRWW